ncbi:tripartite tricarboxylate transporter substrate binding protein [Burkholderia sp. R-69980]|nr:tripartite tricarboxylate transporter substrate binding protein [Burkholderia sp. R-69980]
MNTQKRLSRREILAAGLSLAATACFPIRANATTDWPAAGTIKMIVPFNPGASTDTLARFIASGLSRRLSQNIIVENKSGAGGVIGTEYVANQPPDGYTLLFQTNPFISAPMIIAGNHKLPYDPAKDFQPIGQIAVAPLLIVVSNDLKVTTLREFLDVARTKPMTMSYGSAGIGSINHMAVELLSSMANVKLVHVPYTGLGPALTDLLGGRLQMIAASLPSVLPYVNAGKMRALAITASGRSSLVPNLPTVAEAAVPGYQVEAWWGMFAPAKLPVPITQRLNSELDSLLASPSIVEVLAREGASRRPISPDDFRKMILADVPRWRKLIQEAHIVAG